MLWLCIFAATLVWSAISPNDYPTWILEVFPALGALVVLAWTWRRFPLTPLVYWLILVHCIILMIGGHYTYAKVPLFDWVEHLFAQSRNNYDKLGHLAQGFVPVLVAREILIRRRIVNGRWWTHFISICICLAISAAYELIEWLVDTQSDMAWALLGAILGVLVLGRLHDRQIARIESAVAAA
jgi:putative membrane protein